MAHAKLSPSSSARWMSCPGSVVLTDGAPRTSSSYADEGTAAHFLASECLTLGEGAERFLGRSISITDEGAGWATISTTNDFLVDADMVKHVQVYLDYIYSLVGALQGTLFVEVPLPLHDITGEVGAQGTADAVILAGDEIIVVDLKYGRGEEVQAEDNSQLLLYACAARRQFELANPFQTARLAICQPRVSSLSSEWACTVEYLDDFEAEVASAASTAWRMLSAEIPPAFSPEEKACRWCAAKATCQALADKVQHEVGADFDNLLLAKKPEVQTDGALSKKMACVDLIEGWCKAVRAKVEEELLRGHPVEGWKLVQGRRGSRAWTDVEAVEALLKGMRLKVDQMYDFKLISPTAAEKVLGDSPKRWNKVQELITQSEGKPSVAPVTDKRPAIAVAPTADDFQTV